MCSGNAVSLVWETGRSEAAISEAHKAVVVHIHANFPHLIDERSFAAWAPKFADFSAAYVRKGVPIANLIGFIDGKLWRTARPTMGQRAFYSGHKRCHGVKVQGIVFPNGMQPFPFGPIHGSRHDSFVLQASGVVGLLRQVCRLLGRQFVLFGDSAYPISLYLYRMYRGQLQAWQQAFNSAMVPPTVSVEWGFGKIASLWPWFDFSRSQQVRKRDVGAYLRVANVFTNMHTCLYGSIVSDAFDMSPPSLSAYMAGGPF
jgi:hypothetical protein